MSRTNEMLMEIYDALLAHFGPQRWWPSQAGTDTPAGQLEVCIGAILTQNTNWRNVERALANLRAADAMDLTALHEMPAERLGELIRPAGYFRRKAGRVQNFVAKVVEFGQGVGAFLDRSAGSLREDLLSVSGIGPETADSIVLYAAGLPTFVVDAYTARIFTRHQLIGPEDDYESIQALFEDALEPEVALYNEYHALIVATGKTFCKTRKPKCDRCPLGRFPHEVDEPWLEH